MGMERDRIEAALRHLPALQDDLGMFVEGDAFVPFIEGL